MEACVLCGTSWCVSGSFTPICFSLDCFLSLSLTHSHTHTHTHFTSYNNFICSWAVGLLRPLVKQMLYRYTNDLEWRRQEVIVDHLSRSTLTLWSTWQRSTAKTLECNLARKHVAIWKEGGQNWNGGSSRRRDSRMSTSFPHISRSHQSARSRCRFAEEL